MQFQDETFDFVYSILTLQHMKKEDAYVTLSEIYRVLKPGGRAIFSFPNFLSDEYFKGYLKTVKTPDFSLLEFDFMHLRKLKKS